MSTRIKLSGLLAVAMLAVGCGGDDGDDEASVTSTLEAFVTALEDGDTDAACSKLASSTLEDLEVADSCDEVMTEAVALLGEKGVEIPEYEIADVTIDGETAEATLISAATEDTVPLVREDGEWLILGATAMTQIHPDAPLESERFQGEVGG